MTRALPYRRRIVLSALLTLMQACSKGGQKAYCAFPSPDEKRVVTVLRQPLELRISGATKDKTNSIATSDGEPGLAEAAWNADSSAAAWLVCRHKEEALAGGYDWNARSALADGTAVQLVAANLNKRYQADGEPQAAIKWACSEAGHQRFANEVSGKAGVLPVPR